MTQPVFVILFSFKKKWNILGTFSIDSAMTKAR